MTPDFLMGKLENLDGSEGAPRVLTPMGTQDLQEQTCPTSLPAHQGNSNWTSWHLWVKEGLSACAVTTAAHPCWGRE